MLLVAIGIVLMGSVAFAGGKAQRVYLFGVGAAFGDSVVYFTDIQYVEGTDLVKKGFLDNRSDYSYQLKNYLENRMNLPHRTCAIYFSEKKSALEKKFLKVRKKYQADTTMVFRTLNAGEFQFVRTVFEE